MVMDKNVYVCTLHSVHVQYTQKKLINYNKNETLFLYANAEVKNNNNRRVKMKARDEEKVYIKKCIHSQCMMDGQQWGEKKINFKTKKIICQLSTLLMWKIFQTEKCKLREGKNLMNA